MYNKEEELRKIEKAKNNFARKLKKLRIEQYGDLPVQAVAEKIGIAPASLGNNYENESKPQFPKCEQLIMLKHFYNVPYEYLLNESENKLQENIANGRKFGLSDLSMKILEKINGEAQNDLDFVSQNIIIALNKIVESCADIENVNNKEAINISEESFLYNLGKYITLPIGETNNFVDNLSIIDTHKNQIKNIELYNKYNVITSLDELIATTRQASEIKDKYNERLNINENFTE